MSVKPTIIRTDYFEKVVIQDGVPKGTIVKGELKYTYKVKRIEKGVMDYVQDSGLFKVNDTILVNQLQLQ